MLYQLPEFGSSVVFSSGHAIFGRSPVSVLSDVLGVMMVLGKCVVGWVELEIN